MKTVFAIISLTILTLALYKPQQVSALSQKDILSRVNQERVIAHLKPLIENKKLDLSARIKACDISYRGYWSHITPEGKDPWTFFTQVGYQYRYAGENLAKDFKTDKEIISAWMNSPAHRVNILEARFKETGVGICKGVVAQHFGTI